MTAAEANHIPLGDTGWVLWRDTSLRGAGFPADRLLELCDDELPVAADRVDDSSQTSRDQYDEVFTAAVDRLTATIRRVAADSIFREAVTWQNPGLIQGCLDKVAAGERRNVRGRYRELVISTYLQRYCLKNDTIGFFGPVGWATIGADDTGLEMVPGPALLSRRTTYFESWAVDAVADVIAARAEVWPWLRPQRVPSATLTGRLVRVPFRRPSALTALEGQLVARCDGSRSVRDLIGDPADPRAVGALLRLQELGVLRVGLSAVGFSANRPEDELAAQLDTIPDEAVRARAAAPLQELVRARDAVAAAAGRLDELVSAGQELSETFQRLTDSAPTRRHGEAYAGRTLVYEDTVRDVDVRIGRRVIEPLAAPLGLVLDSAVWLSNTVAQRYTELAEELLDRELDRTGDDSMPLLQLLTAVLPEFGALDGRGLRSEVVEDVIADFRRRWQRVVELPAEALLTTSRHTVTAAEIAGRAAEEFATQAPRWAGARWHSPDVMLVGDGPAAFARGDVDVVLGELHCASNTLETQLFVAQHPDPAQLRAAATASGLTERVIIVPRADAPQATSRMSRSTDLLLDDYVYVSLGEESATPPAGARTISVVDLVVRRRGDELVVADRGHATEYRFEEVIGEPLSGLVADGFQPFGGASHRPRVTIDRLVVCREAWRFPAAEVAWAFVKDERLRYREARRWMGREGISERGFVRVPVDRKPMAVDFRSLPLVNLLGKSIRRTAGAGPGQVTITEMLPDIDRLWLRDGDGARYTAELRVVAVTGT